MLLVQAALRHGVKAGAILCVDNYIFERTRKEAEKTGGYAPHEGVVVTGSRQTLQIAVQAVATMSG